MSTFSKGSRVFINTGSDSFSGVVVEVGVGCIRVMGRGSYDHTTFNEWFCLNAPKVKITSAPAVA